MSIWGIGIILIIIFEILHTSDTAEPERPVYTLVPKGIIKKDSCYYVYEIDIEKRCEWVKTTADCVNTDDSFIKYTKILFCFFKTPAWQYVGAAFAILWLLCLFIMIGTTADEFFCPSLTMLSAALKLSENVAGVTVLAFGNGAPDIITSIRGVDTGFTELVYNEIMGGGMFVTLFVIGVLCIKCPFRPEGNLFLRDCIFYLIAVSWSFWCLHEEVVELWQSLVFLVLYVVYIGFVIASQHFQQSKTIRTSLEKEFKSLTSEPKELLVREGSRRFVSATNNIMPAPVPLRQRSASRTAAVDLALLFERISMMSQRNSQVALNALLEGDEPEDSSSVITGPRTSMVKEFLNEMIPIDIEEWRTMNLGEKIFSCVKVPFILVLKLVIPVVNQTAVNNGWCKLLSLINCFTMPFYCLFATGYSMHEILPGVPLLIPIALLSVALLVFVALTSSQDRPPVYHPVFAFMGFFSSVVTVYLVAAEVVSLLNTIGILFSVSDTTLGVTVLAWGNSIGDLITTISLATAGYPRMGFAGCYGGPLFNILLGLGLALTLKTISNGIQTGSYKVKVKLGSLAGNIILYLISGLVSAVIILPTMGFEARRSFGCYFVLVYFLFNLRIFLNELKIIHPLANTYQQAVKFPNGTIEVLDT